MVCLTGSIAAAPRATLASGKLTAVSWPYVPGSVIPIRVDGLPAPYRAVLVGPGELLGGGYYDVPDNAPPGSSLLVAGNAAGLAARTIRLGTIPDARRPLLAVVSYDDGIVFHDPRTFAVRGVLATGGTPSDVAVDRRGRIAAPDTQGTTVTIAGLMPWSVSHVGGIPFGDDVAIDDTTHAIFVTNRDVNGRGALSRIAPNGSVSRVVTGTTAEGIAIDERRQIVYVANVNDGTIAEVDARTMRIVRRIPAVARVFSLALSPDDSHLFAISNQSASSPFAAPGSAIAIDVSQKRPRVVARSSHLTFPIGTVLDAATHTLFVTDESLDLIYVLDARTLHQQRPPIRTCHTPWKPSLDESSQRLYVPCARSNDVDVLDARTMQRISGAPFKTGGYPLAVAIWHPPAKVTQHRSAY
jgi:DNA-binding beta-propeller fold protein YncE